MMKSRNILVVSIIAILAAAPSMAEIASKDYVDEKITKSSYSLPTASESSLGGVKIGEGVSVDVDGSISVDLSDIEATVEKAASNASAANTTATEAKNTADQAKSAADDATSAVETLTSTVGGKQDKLTAGTNITIDGNTISSTVPVANGTTVGGVKTGGEHITITDDGTISADLTGYATTSSVEAANTAASKAQSAAEAAQSTANSAQSAAETAQSAADSAQETATAAQSGLAEKADSSVVTKLSGDFESFKADADGAFKKLDEKQDKLKAGTNITINNDGKTINANIPVATASAVGGVKTGSHITIDTDGTISADLTGYATTASVTAVDTKATNAQTSADSAAANATQAAKDAKTATDTATAASTTASAASTAASEAQETASAASTAAATATSTANTAKSTADAAKTAADAATNALAAKQNTSNLTTAANWTTDSAGTSNDSKYPSDKAVKQELDKKVNTSTYQSAIDDINGSLTSLSSSKQDTLTAGTNISISGKTISATIPTASATTTGGIKLKSSGGDITVGSDGVATVAHATKADSANSATTATSANTATSATSATNATNAKNLCNTKTCTTYLPVWIE